MMNETEQKLAIEVYTLEVTLQRHLHKKQYVHMENYSTSLQLQGLQISLKVL